ncbi:MAG: DUF1015 family protein [Bacteroidales bacterium]|nr:DUF1015 family protein [Bacteroidales bacterium]
MAILKPFKGLRPPKSIVKYVAAKPYDVLSSKEAREEAKDNQYSLLHITKPEIDFPEEIDEHDPRVYEKAKENFEKFLSNKWLIPDEEEYLYIYSQTMNDHTQYGIVGCSSIDEYFNGTIKRHELTRKDKEEDRMNHVRATNANMEPVFFTFRTLEEIEALIFEYANNNEPEYDFVTDDKIGHRFWVIKNKNTINKIVELYKKVPYVYVADGHHRTAAAVLVGKEKREKNKNYNGTEEFNYFMAVHFPHTHLKILDYNRVVKSLNNLSESEFIEKIKEHFYIEDKGNEIFKPSRIREFSMYLNNKWYKLTAKPHTYDNNDPIKSLDVTILSEWILNKILDIKDLRTDKRIDFVGGIRGLGELKKRVDSGEMKVAFALYPVSMEQLLNVADKDMIMPPKTTWFEPKLRSGLVIHLLD